MSWILTQRKRTYSRCVKEGGQTYLNWLLASKAKIRLKSKRGEKQALTRNITCDPSLSSFSDNALKLSLNM